MSRAAAACPVTLLPFSLCLVLLRSVLFFSVLHCLLSFIAFFLDFSPFHFLYVSRFASFLYFPLFTFAFFSLAPWPEPGNLALEARDSKSEEFNRYQSIKYKEISIINDSGIKLSKYQLLSIKEIMYQSINLRSIKVSSIKYKKVSSI